MGGTSTVNHASIAISPRGTEFAGHCVVYTQRSYKEESLFTPTAFTAFTIFAVLLNSANVLPITTGAYVDRMRVTVNPLRLAHTSPAAFPSLLASMEEELRKSPPELTRFPRLAVQNLGVRVTRRGDNGATVIPSTETYP